MMASGPGARAADTEDLPAVNRLFIAALIALAESAQADHACRILAQALSMLRHSNAREAEHLNAALDRLKRDLSVASHGETGATNG